MIRKNVYLFLILLFIFCSCGSIPEINYYVIDYPVESISDNSKAKFNVILGVETFETAPIYEEDRIVYRDSPYEVKFYNYHHWIIPPKDMVTDKVIGHFSESHLFEQVVPYPRFSQVDLICRGTLKAFEEWDVDNDWYARVKIHFELVSKKSNQLIWHHTVANKIRVPEKNTLTLVETMGKSLQGCVNEALAEIEKFLFNNRN